MAKNKNNSLKINTPLWGKCESVMAVAAMPEAEIRRFLPRAVDLHPQNLTPPGTHPMVFMFNSQKIHIFFSGFVNHYHEMIPLIPAVHFKHDPCNIFQMSPLLYVSNYMIVWGAQQLWNLNKTFATFRSTPPIASFSQTGKIEQQVLKGTLPEIVLNAQTTGKVHVPDSMPYFQQLLPWLNCNAIIDAPNEQYYTAFYRIKATEIQNIDAQIEVKNLPGFTPKVYSFGGIEGQVTGAFRLQFDWQLDFPKKTKILYPQKTVIASHRPQNSVS